MIWKTQKRSLLTLAFMLLLLPASVAAQSSSTNYQVEEATFGTGGDVDLNSTNYQAQGGVGNLGVGSASSTNYDTEAGFFTPNEPFLEFIVNTTTVNLGDLTTSTTGTGTATFSVRTYLSSAYAIQTLSSPPTSEGGAQLDPMTTGAASAQGTEQFGINLRDNSSPNIGADLVNEPDGTFADGFVSTGYGTVNTFKYVQGQTIAGSPATPGNQAVGKTTYTLSYIANIGPLTEAGTYKMDHDLVAVTTY